jgi:hypothetical protein
VFNMVSKGGHRASPTAELLNGSELSTDEWEQWPDGVLSSGRHM